MFRPTPKTTSSSQRGYALVLVMVALVTLTILGVTQITATQLDMKITQNMRHHKQLQYGAITGQDHGRDMAEDDGFDAMGTWSSAMFQTDHCTPDWIGATASSVATSVPLMANGFTMADYAVDFLRRPVHGRHPPGLRPVPGDDETQRVHDGHVVHGQHDRLHRRRAVRWIPLRGRNGGLQLVGPNWRARTGRVR